MQVGIKVFDRHGRVLGVLWQHLDADAVEVNLAGDIEDPSGSLGFKLADWSGDWQPQRPDLKLADTYRILTR